MENAPFILALGIRSYNKAKALTHHSVALWSVQKRRESIIPGTGKRIHDYVPLYFATHTPMQYLITNPAPTKGRDKVLSQKDLVFIDVDATKVFSLDGVIFTDGNAASNETNFYSDLADLDKLDWYRIRLPNAYPHCYDDEWQRVKASEVLVPDHIPVKFFSRVVVFCPEAEEDLDREVKKLAEELRKEIPEYRCTIVPEYYF